MPLQTPSHITCLSLLSPAPAQSHPNYGPSLQHPAQQGPPLVIPSLEGTVICFLGMVQHPHLAARTPRQPDILPDFAQDFTYPLHSPSLNRPSICFFFLHKEGLKHKTIKCYLSGIRHAHIAAGFPDPFNAQAQSRPRLDYIIKGHQQTAGPLRSQTIATFTNHAADSLENMPTLGSQERP